MIRNPFAGRYEPDLMPFRRRFRELGRELAAGVVERLGGSAMIEAYGKGVDRRRRR